MSERKLRWSVRLGLLLLRALGSTWRMREHNGAPVRKHRSLQKSVIFSLWHGELLPLLWYHRNQGIVIVISEHSDGEIIARVAHALGYATVRGSTTRGGGRALIGLIRVLAQGRDGAVTPDGPRGPSHEFAPGIAVASQRSGVPIAPVRVSASRAWRLKSWDRFMIPKPFARVDVTYGPLTHVVADSPREAAEQTPALQALMDSIPGG